MKKKENFEDMTLEDEKPETSKDETEQEHCHCQEGGECCCEGECECGDDCQCDENCDCHQHEESECHHHNHECENEHTHNKKHKHHCHEQESCECDDDCHCDDEFCDCHSDEAGQYLLMAQRLQADFDNYRKRVAEQLDYQREEGKKSVIEVFLPCLDTFKEAKKSITDESVLAGVNMIETKILNALKSLNVEKIEAVGQKFDHNFHEVIAVMRDESKEEDIILEEYQAGYVFNGKVIRYSKVIVNKLS